MVGEYIKREDAINEIEEYALAYKECSMVLNFAKRAIEKIPSAIVVPARYGEWKRGISENGCTTEWFCSVCHYENRHCYDWRFCPNCGARMEGE